MSAVTDNFSSRNVFLPDNLSMNANVDANSFEQSANSRMLVDPSTRPGAVMNPSSVVYAGAMAWPGVYRPDVR